MTGFGSVVLFGKEIEIYDPLKVEMLRLMKDAVEECGENVTYLEYYRRSGFNYRSVQKAFGTWADMREEAGLPRIARLFREPRYEDEEIVEFVREMARERGERISQAEFSRATGISGANIHRLFGGWLKLRELAGLSAEKKPVQRRHSAESIEAALQKFAGEQGGALRLREFCIYADISESSLWYHCGSWTRLLRKLGIERSRVPGCRWSDMELLEEFDRVAGKLGKIPTYAEFNLEGRCSWNALFRRFGRKAELERRYAEYVESRESSVER